MGWFCGNSYVYVTLGGDPRRDTKDKETWIREVKDAAKTGEIAASTTDAPVLLSLRNAAAPGQVAKPSLQVEEATAVRAESTFGQECATSAALEGSASCLDPAQTP